MQGGRVRSGEVLLAAVGLAVGVLVALLIVDTRAVLAMPTLPASVLGMQSRRADPSLDARVRAATVAVVSHGCVGALRGTGVVTTGGLLITAAHVAGGARILDVTNSTGGHGFLAPVIAASGSDVASVGVPASWPQLREASADAAVGDEVVVAGRSSGSTVVRHARVEAILHGRGPDDPAQVVRLDVGVAPGDSGGPVVNASGRLVGIVYAAELRTHLALVIPRSELAASLARDGSVNRC